MHSARHLRAGTFALALLGSARGAAAADPPRQWYGDMTLLADAGALSLLIAGLAVNDSDMRQWLRIGSGAAYLVGAPIVHVAHERGAGSLASLGLRVAAPVLGGFAGSQLSGLAAPNDGDEVVIGTVFGILGGFVTAVVVDASLLAWRPASPPPAAAARPERSWWPSVALSGTRAELGVAGQF